MRALLFCMDNFDDYAVAPKDKGKPDPTNSESFLHYLVLMNEVLVTHWFFLEYGYVDLTIEELAQIGILEDEVLIVKRKRQGSIFLIASSFHLFVCACSIHPRTLRTSSVLSLFLLCSSASSGHPLFINSLSYIHIQSHCCISAVHIFHRISSPPGLKRKRTVSQKILLSSDDEDGQISCVI
jgi:hypothetical protein